MKPAIGGELMRGAQTRHILLEASAKEILAHGYAGASLTSIGARLGLTKGALAYHFPAKKDLAEALLGHLRETMQQEFTTARQTYPDRGLHALITMLLGLGWRTANEPQVAAGLTLVIDRSSPVIDVAELVSGWQRSLTELVAAAQSTDEIDIAMNATDIAEHLMVTSVGVAALADRTFRHDGSDRMRTLRQTLTLLGARNIDQIVAEAVQARPPGLLPPPSGVSKNAGWP